MIRHKRLPPSAILAVPLILLAALPAAAQPTTAPAATQPGAPPTQSTVTVAVFDFVADTPGAPETGKQVAEVVAALMGAEPGLRLVDRASLDRVVDELELGASGLVDQQAAQAGRLVGAKLLIVGKVFTLDETAYLSARLIGTETSLMKPLMVTADAGGTQGPDLGKMSQELSLKLAQTVRDQTDELLPEPMADPLPPLVEQVRTALADAAPSVYIKIPERHFGGARGIDPAARTELESLFREAGFAVTADARSADWLVEGEAFSEFGTRLGDLVSCSARVEAQLSRNQGERPRSVWSGRATARAADLGEQTAGKLALERAAREVAVDLFDEVLRETTAKPDAEAAAAEEEGAAQ